MKIDIHELAAQEFDDAIDWYELQLKGLGSRFKQTVTNEVKRIKKNPRWFLVEEANIYKAFIPKFPYKIIYTIEDKRIIIWSIAHLHRKPWYWQSRMI